MQSVSAATSTACVCAALLCVKMCGHTGQRGTNCVQPNYFPTFCVFHTRPTHQPFKLNFKAKPNLFHPRNEHSIFHMYSKQCLPTQFSASSSRNMSSGFGFQSLV
ncbi:hypothetical protein I79_026152 [Cricetulus griseus]|uniref:Secreted protein n=1 Tax=Cricetulus griseus TaxID=10029 RepID=G3IQ61_CRIGR|nr:hypothetical protein I79_026152 [Cricetulus griseus]